MLLKSRVQIDRAFALLPWYAEHLCAWPEEDLSAERAWFGAAEEVHTLQLAFALAHDEGRSPGNTSVATSKLKDRLDELDEVFDLRIRGAEKESGAKANRQIMVLLQSPLLKADKRAELADKQRRLAVKLHEATAALDQEDHEAARSPRAADLAAVPPERNAAELRARMSVALVRLARPAAGKSFDILIDAQWSEHAVTAARAHCA